MLIGKGSNDGYLTQLEMSEIVSDSLDALSLGGKRVLFIIPDGTRSLPMPAMFSLFEEYLSHRVSQLDYLVALGTHPPMNDDQLSRHIGRQVINGCLGNTHIYNHAWQDAATFVEIGKILADEMNSLTSGVLSQHVPVRLNKLIYDYDQVIICGPVFPHEVVGFSGGNKYLFPGIAGPEIINLTHWLGALITCYKVIGTNPTPVRVVIERAAQFVKVPTACFALVVDHKGTSGLFFGPTMEAWQAAAKLSAQRHIIYKERSYKKVLSIMPPMYQDLWTAAKGMYKVEPVVEDGGEVIIYAPHVLEISYTHGKLIDEIGYHCRDYFLAQWEFFKDYPGGVLAHSTHLKGLGEYNRVTKIETPRIEVTLATGIEAGRCRKVNLGYRPPQDIVIEQWQGCEDQGVLVVPQAGERLYRLKAQILDQPE